MEKLNSNTTAGGPQIWRKAMYVTLAILSFLYLSITIILFYVRRRRIEDIRYRPLRLNILNVVASIMLCVMICLRTAFYPDQYPCILIHWPAYIGFFLYCSALSCRVFAFTWVAKYNLAKLRMSIAYTPHQSSFNFSNISNDNNNNNNNLPPMSPGARERLDFPGSKLTNRLKKLKHFATDKWLTYWVICPTMVVALVLALAAQFTTPSLSIKPLNTHCEAGLVQYIPIFVLIGTFLLFLCPILIFLIYDIKDAYGLKKELMVTLFTGAFAYAAFFVIEIILPRWRNYFGSLMFAWMTFILCHTLSITMPLIRSFKNKTYVVPSSKFSSARNKVKRSISVKRNNQKDNNNNNGNGDGKSKRYIMFEKALEDPELFEHYKICAAACFCTELIIFLQEYQYLKTLVAHCCIPTKKEIFPSPPSPKVLITDAGHITFPENQDLYSSPVPLISPSFVTTPCTIPITETVAAASWIPFPHELLIDYNNFYETFFDSDSDLAINFPGSLLSDTSDMIKNGKYELTMYEHAREEVLNLLYRNTFERFLKMCGPDIAKKGL